MSAYVVNKTHIDALVTAAEASGFDHMDPLTYYWPDVTESDTWEQASEKYHRLALSDYPGLDTLGQMLWSENLASIHYRYPDTIDDPNNIPGPADFTPDDILRYRFERLQGRPDPLIVLQAISCYEYQSCEHPGWRTSQAHAVCDALRDKMISWLTRGTQGGWDIHDRNIFCTRKAVSA